MVHVHLSESAGVPYYQQLVEQIQLLVAMGHLVHGEQLPSVRKFAEQLLINPNTVARAYRELEGLGVVVSKRGAGVFVQTGQSPLSNQEKKRRLSEKIEALLAEAKTLGVPLNSLLEMIRRQAEKLNATTKAEKA